MARLWPLLAILPLLALVLAPTMELAGGPTEFPANRTDGMVRWTAPPSLVPPRVLSTSPAPGSVVGPSTVIDIRFTARMDPASVEGALSYSDGNSLYTVADGTTQWTNGSAPDDTMRFDPRLEFATGGTVTVYIDGGVARDFEANLLDGNQDGIGGDGYSWSFSIIADTTPPRVLQVEPVAGAENVSISTSIRVVFSKAMVRSSVENGFGLAGDGAPTLTRANGTVSWSGARFPDDTVLFNPDPNLKNATTYNLTIPGSGTTDREGRGLDGNGNGVSQGSPVDDLRIQFTTEAEDTTPPTVVGTTPAADATDVNPTTWIHVVFSERLDRASVEQGFSYTDGTAVYTVANGTASWASGLDAFSFRPTRTLAFGTRYTASLDATVAQDETGNLLNGGANETWRFTTAEQSDTGPPRILWTTPFDGQENVSRTQRFSIIFSEPMDRASVRSGIGITEDVVLADFRWPNDATVEFAALTPMGYKTAYVLFVRAVSRDLSGNEMFQSKQIRFVTEPWRGTVSGRVEDTSGDPLGGAHVQLGGRVVLTNGTGDFAIGSVEQGAYALSVSRDGFEVYRQEVVIAPEQGALGTIVLRPVPPPSNVALVIAAAAVVLGAIVVVAFLRWRRRPEAEPPYETWKPAKVVVMEPPGEPEAEWDEGELEGEPR